MSRRLPRRMWHTVAALVPLPLIALGYVAAVPGNPVAFEVELYLAGKGSDQSLTRRAEAAPERLPREAAPLFRAKGKEPRADQYLARNTVTSAGKQLIAASLTGDPATTGAVSRRGEFVGTMSTPTEITTRDFDLRSFEWLTQLFGARRHVPPVS